MLWRLFNWIPVVFGLKFAGVAASAANAAALPEGISRDTSNAVPSFKVSDAKTTSGRTASGTSVTSISQPGHTFLSRDSFQFADDIRASTPLPTRNFVMRPLASTTQRPVARIKTKVRPQQAVRRNPSQVKQTNRPTARAEMKVAGKRTTKRVVCMVQRTQAVNTGGNVIAFPTLNAVQNKPAQRLAA